MNILSQNYNNLLKNIIFEVFSNNLKLQLNNTNSDVFNCLIESYSHRKDSIESKKQYILNNWNNIHNLYKYNLSCPMESQISHNIADLFTSRPKGFSVKMTNKLTKIRMHYKNNHNLKELYLNNFNSNTTLTINKDFLNFNIFDKYNNYNLYSNKIYDPAF